VITVPRRRISDDILEQLSGDILSGRWTPGEKLPRERELADRFSVARVSIRDALKQLEGRGLVTVRHGQGAFVTDVIRHARLEAIESLVGAGSAHRAAVFEGLHDFRVHVLPEMARLAALRRGEEQLRGLRAVIEQEREEANPRRFRDLDWTWVHGLSRATQNPIYTLLMNTMRSIHEKWAVLFYSIPGTIERTRVYHRRVVEAVARRRPTAAARALRDLLRYSHPLLVENLPEL
jgi:GntR family transcriptional repressor for pyruvate dehydrogenase complex